MMWSTKFATSILGALIIIPSLVHADSEALWLEPSLKWYGIDGNWSSIGIFVGEPSQQIDVTVSTALSEIWVVESGGCSPSALCTAARGNVFNISASDSWSSLGAWQLGLDYLGQGGNGDYAMDSVVAYDSKQRRQTNLGTQLIAGVNTTAYYTGLFGLGITPGAFGDSVVVQSPIATLVEQVGTIPSHSYGYTAGAYYGGDHGMPLSLVLGGYDENRFVAHDISFNLNTTERLPTVLLRGITASVSSVDKAPTEWNATSSALLSFNESVKALIDTSTPYLWLPEAICDRFAQALNLTWNETFGLYLFSDDAIYQTFQAKEPDLSFTFTLSGADDRDNFGLPFDAPGVVNITISSNAFAQALRYPFMNAIEYGDAAIPYFPLKRLENGNRVILGRSFMQEAYLIMNYETSLFSVHQATFPDSHWNTSVVTMAASDGSPFPGAPKTTSEARLTREQIIGVVVGACLIGMAMIVTVWCVHRRKKQKKNKQTRRSTNNEEDLKAYDCAADPDPPRSPVGKFLFLISKKFSGRKKEDRTRKARNVHEVDGATPHPVEVSADERVHEMAVPMEPVELDATDTASINGTTELGTEDTRNLSAYEMARRQIDRQLQGPVPAYTPSLSPHEEPYGEAGKSIRDISPVAHYRPSDDAQPEQLSPHPSPSSTPSNDNFAQSIPLPSPLPSPMTPHEDWSGRIPDFPLPSPLTFVPTPTFPSSMSFPGTSQFPPSPNTLDYPSVSRSGSSDTDRSFQISPAESMMASGPPIQRTPIDPTKVVCLGPLPDNIRLPGQQMLRQQPSIPRLVGPDGHECAVPAMPYAEEPSDMDRRESTTDTLGSNFTVEEEARVMEEMSRQGNTFGMQPPKSPVGSAHTVARIDDGVDLIHVPQPAKKRYSWEEDR